MLLKNHRLFAPYEKDCQIRRLPLTGPEWEGLEKTIVMLIRRRRALSLPEIVDSLVRWYWESDIRAGAWFAVGNNRLHVDVDFRFRPKRRTDRPFEN